LVLILLGVGLGVGGDYLLAHNNLLIGTNAVAANSSPKSDRSLVAQPAIRVKVDAKELPVVKVGDSKILQAGEMAIAIGNPLGLDNTVT
jgi:hypothetical protein